MSDLISFDEENQMGFNSCQRVSDEFTFPYPSLRDMVRD